MTLTPTIHLCFFSHSSDFWGAEQSLFDILSLLKENKISCTLVCPGPGLLVNRAKEIGIPCILIPYEKWVSRDHPIVTRALRRLRTRLSAYLFSRRYRGYGFTHIYSNSLTISIGSYVAEHLKLPHLWHMREYGLKHHGWRFDCSDDAAYTRIMTQSTRIISVSHSVATIIKEASPPTIPTPPICVIRNRVAMKEKILPSPLNVRDWTPLRCIILGHVNPSKNPLFAIKGIAQLVVEQGLKIQLTLVGGSDQDYLDKIKSDPSYQTIASSITLIPFSDTPLDYLNKVHLLIVPSLNEASPRVIVEAMRCAKPVLTNNSGGADELVLESDCGLVYHADNLVSFKEQLSDIYHNPEKMIRKAKNGFDWTETHLTKTSYLNQFKEVL